MNSRPEATGEAVAAGPWAKDNPMIINQDDMVPSKKTFIVYLVPFLAKAVPAFFF